MAHWYDQIRPKFVSNVANKYLLDNEFDAFQVFPKVNSRQLSGYVAKYDKADWLKIGTVNDYKRIGATESVGEGYEVDKQLYTLEEFAFHYDITKDDAKEYDNPFDPVNDAVDFVMQRLRRVLLQNVVNSILTTGVWGTDHNETSSKWDAKTSGVSDVDPVDKVMTWAEEIEKVTGFAPNRAIIAADVFRALKGNTHIMNRMKTTNDKVVTVGLLAKLFELDKIYIANAVNSDATDYMVNGSMLLYYVPDRPSKFKPAAAYHITYKGRGGNNIITKRIPMPHLNDALRIEASVKSQLVVLATDLGVYAYNLTS